MKNRIIVRMKMTVPSATRCLAFVAIASDSSFTLGGFELGENKKIRDSLRISMEVSLRRVFRSSGIFSGSSSAFCSASSLNLSYSAAYSSSILNLSYSAAYSASSLNISSSASYSASSLNISY